MIFIPFFTLITTEIIKVIVQSIRVKELRFAWFAHPGGMPSGHASFTSSVATLVAYIQGYNSTEFLIALTFAIIVIYDARGIRATVGKHAQLLNTFSKKFKLEESVGHTNWEVIVGTSLGITITILMIKIFGI